MRTKLLLSFWGLLLLIGLAASAKPPKTVMPAAQTVPKASPNWWAFRPVATPKIPKVKQINWAQNPIDAFVLAKLEAKGLTPNPPADKRTLLRRVTFDLTGLPPTPEEVDTFLNDKSPNAYIKVIDRLLASPQYGERWGRHWLDLVRYTDSLDKRDTDTIRDINDAWRYRDWVVNALNRDMPYNEFIQNQIAGDLLPGAIPNEINKPGTIATGLLAIGNWGNGDGDKLKSIANMADDQIDVISRGVMGLTVSCARCHDHKFDPISTKDYYALAGIFYSTHILPKFQPNDAMETPLKIPLLTRLEKKARADYAAELLQAETTLETVSAKPLATYAKKMLPETSRYVYATWAFRNRGEEQAGLSLADFAKTQGLEPELLKHWRDYFAFGDYKLLDVPLRDLEGTASVHLWKSKAATPYVMFNTNPVARKFGTVEIPRISAAVHPGKKGVVVGWKSPITGKIALIGIVKSGDTASGGDGIAWWVDHRTASGYRTIAGESIASGEAEPLLDPVTRQPQIVLNVKRGESVQFVVLPQENAEHDATQIQLLIFDTRGQQWNLIFDCVDDVLMRGKGNPHPDKYGNSDVWYFLDMADSHRGDERSTFEEARIAFQSAGALVGLENAEKVKMAANRFAREFRIDDAGSPFWLKERASWRLLAEADRQKLEQAANRIDKVITSALPPIEYANGIQEGGIVNAKYAGFHDVQVHLRGNPEKLGERVPRRFPAILTTGQQPPRITRGSGRLELAQWLTSPSHPLTARVIVNRLWQHHFGDGIVRTPSNFGKLGERPTHPELLDYLASELVRQKWSLKRIHKLILMSATYRQSSAATERTRKLDADNRLWSRQNRRRLEAEALRDSLLFVAGTLDKTQGGKAINEVETRRRAIYQMTVRSDTDPLRAIFDGADPSACVDQRVRTTVSPQALYLLNNDFVSERAKETAARILRSAQDDAARLTFAYRLLFGREPNTSERQIGAKFLAISKLQSDETQAWRDYAHLLLCTNELVMVD